jgi:hypothetical protein
VPNLTTSGFRAPSLRAAASHIRLPS